MRNRVDKFVRGFLIFLMGFMLVNVVWQVFSRYVLQSPSTVTSEMSRFILIWISLLGGAYASGKRMHLAINLFPNKLSNEGRRILSIIIDLFIIGFVVVVLVIGGGQLVYITYSLEQTSSALGVSLAYIYMVLPLSGFLIVYYKVLDILEALNRVPETQKNIES